jgi:DNA-binding NtrC family response regulator
MEQSQPHFENVRPLRPLRVVVAAADPRFGRVAGFLLARRGFEVELLRRPSNVLDFVFEKGADIVILDATDSLSEAERSLAAIEASHPHVTVILVADEGSEPQYGTQQILPKWTSLETLILNLEAMHLGLART